MGDFDEEKHPRANDGKFSSGGGEAGGHEHDRGRALIDKAKASGVLGKLSPDNAARVAKARESGEHAGVSYGAAQLGVNPYHYYATKEALDKGKAPPPAFRLHEDDMHAIAQHAKQGADQAELSARAEIAHEEREREAGRITSIPHEARDAFEDRAAHAANQIDSTVDALADAHRDVIGHLRTLDAYEDAHGHKHGVDTDDLASTLGEVHGVKAAADQLRGHEAREHDAKLENVDPHHEPAESEDDSGEPTEASHREFLEHAKNAQSALEALHAQQTAALAHLQAQGKDVAKAHKASVDEVDGDSEDLIHEPAFAHYARGDDDEILDEHGRQSYEGARTAAETAQTHEVASREGRFDKSEYGEHLNTLKGAIRATASAAKKLAKVTGREAALDKPAAAKADKAPKESKGPAGKAGEAKTSEPKGDLDELDHAVLRAYAGPKKSDKAMREATGLTQDQLIAVTAGLREKFANGRPTHQVNLHDEAKSYYGDRGN